MPRIIYITHDGKRFEIEAAEGDTVMETAVRAGLPGILAECGGACSCATCHVHIDPAFAAIVGEAESMEADMLCFALEASPGSRLACQLKISQAWDGLIVHIPKRQV